MVDNHFRWDFIGLSTDEKPTPATSSKVVDGSTFYCSDNSKLYVFCKDTWYEKTATGGGGGTTYTAGDGIDITEGEISVDPTYVATLEELDARINKGAGAPTTSTEGVVGGLYEDTTNGKLYICTEVTEGTDPDPDTYTWEEFDTTYSNFVGTDGSSAGTAGLVPAPATTDAGKFLKADGTWSTAGGSGSTIKTLTSADKNWPTSNPTGIALWKLESGIYRLGENGLDVWFCRGSTQSQANRQVDINWGNYLGLFIVRYGIWNGNPSSNLVDIQAYANSPSAPYAYLQWEIDNSLQDGCLSGSTLVVPKRSELIPITGTTAPTASTVATYIGELYVDTTNNDAYICLDTSPGNPLWKKITP